MRAGATQHEHTQADDAEQNVDALAERFSSQDALYPIQPATNYAADESWQMQSGSKRAMHVTLLMLGLSVVTLGAFMVYMRLIMPVPEELGVSQTTLDDGLVPPSHHAERDTPLAADRADRADRQPASRANAGSQPDVPSSIPTPSPRAVTAPRPVDRSRTPRRASVDPVRRAYQCLAHGDASQALALAQKAVLITPKRADAWIALGAAYEAQHNHGAALAAFRDCVSRAAGPYLSQCRVLARD